MMSRTALVFLAAGLLEGATTTTWEMSSYQDFLRGKLTGLSLTRDGRLVLAPALRTFFSSEQPAIWSAAKGPDGALYLGTGHRGRVYRVEPGGASAVAWASDQPEVFAVALDSKGVLYAATSPNGKVYRIQNGKAAAFFDPGAKYIWSLAFAPDGALFVGTGDQGKLFRVDASGKGELYYDSGQSHVTCLAFDREGRLLAGSEPNGILYQIRAKDQGFVLYDSNLPEIRSIATAPDGTIYAAALGGSLSKRTSGFGLSPTAVGVTSMTSPGSSITVSESAAQEGQDVKPKTEPPKPASVVPAPQVSVATAGVFEMTGVERSALYKIHPDHTVETLWSSKEENIYDVALSGGQIVFSTDGAGRIYRLTPDRKAALVVQTNEGEATRLIEVNDGLIAATGNMGKVYHLGQAAGTSGVYDSPVHDAGTVARWGRISWRGSGVTFRTRSGNSSRPDKTWSEWSEPLAGQGSAPIPSPNARYIGWRAEFRGGEGVTASLDSVTVAYLPQNTPPVVRSISVTAVGSSGAAKSAAPVSQTSAFSITVTDTGEAPGAAGGPAQTVARSPSMQNQISWQADDPDGDRLVYALYFRGEEEQEWKLIRRNLYENTLLLDADVLADGRYFFKVVASDLPANPAQYARDAELVSAPILIDNTPPVVTAKVARRDGAAVDIEIDAVDQTSALRRCEYSLDAGPWTPIEAADGVTDSPRERFPLHLEGLRAGEHLVVVRVFDTASNAGLTKVVVR